jgi:hypothetical protein
MQLFICPTCQSCLLTLSDIKSIPRHSKDRIYNWFFVISLPRQQMELSRTEYDLRHLVSSASLSLMSNKAFANTTTQAKLTLGDATRFVASRGERRASGPTFGLWPHGIAVLWQQLVTARIPQFPPLDGHRPSLSSSAKELLSFTIYDQ